MLLPARVAAVSLLFLATALAGCAAPPVEPAAGEVADLLTGTFTSADPQSPAADDTFDLRLVVVPVWRERLDGPWLYVEQAIGARADRPYRQRVVRIRFETATSVVVEDWALPGDPGRWAGAWAWGAPLGDIGPEELVPRSGCDVRLRRLPDGTWKGATEGRGCASDVRGAKYATAEVLLRDGLLQLWDRGFDEHGTQVWGPGNAPHRLVRVSRAPPDDSGLR